MASAIQASATSAAFSREGNDHDPQGKRSLTPERNLQVFSKDSQGLMMAKWPAIEGDTCLAKARSLGWNLFESPDKSWLSHWVNIFILACIILSAIVLVVESIPGIHKKNTAYWDGFEAFFVITFSVELAVRLACCPDYLGFVKSGMNYVDFFSILPWYLNLLVGDAVNLAFLRILRLGRALRLVKLSRYSSGVRLITSSLEQSLDALSLFVFILVILVIVCSSAVYYTERGTYDEATGLYMREDPHRGYKCCAGSSTAPCENGSSSWSYPSNDDFSCTYVKERSPFQSIPEAFWWCMVTLTTVGYGDVYPVTRLGQFIGILTQLLGVITLALPLSIIGSNFIDERTKMLEESQVQELTEKNTVPGREHPIVFPEQRLDMVLERMDLIETELQNMSKTTEMAVMGTLRLQKRLDAQEDKESIVVSKSTMDTMKMLLDHMSASVDAVKCHLN